MPHPPPKKIQQIFEIWPTSVGRHFSYKAIDQKIKKIKMQPSALHLVWHYSGGKTAQKHSVVPQGGGQYGISIFRVTDSFLGALAIMVQTEGFVKNA